MNKNSKLVFLLREIEKNSNATQRDLAKAMDISVGAVNHLIKEAGVNITTSKNGYNLSDAGHEFLSQFKVKNAIIMAAGFGSRMAPLTHTTPKGLIKVRGTPLVERIIKQLHEVGIREIIVVTGYLSRNFDYLASKYGVKLVHNPDFKKNNLYSIAAAADHLSSSYIICQDNWIENNMFNKFEPHSWYAAKYFDQPTKEWCMVEGSNGRIKDVTIGGKEAFGMFGPAYFTPEFSAKFKTRMTEYLSKPTSADYYWEDIVIRHLNEMTMYINDQTGNIFEFDSVEDLKSFDPSYAKPYTRTDEDITKIMKNIDELVTAFGTDKVAMLLSEDGYAEKLKEAMTNIAYKITWRGRDYVLRFAGLGTDKFISRESEIFYTATACAAGCCPPSEFHNNGKLKLTEYIDNARTFDFEKDDLGRVLGLLKDLQSTEPGRKRSLMREISDYENLYSPDLKLPAEYEYLRTTIINYLYNADGTPKYEQTVSHGDMAPVNILISNNTYKLIDFEYAGVLSRYWDLGNFASEIEHYQNIDRAKVIDKMVDLDPTADRDQIWAWSYIVDFVWAAWGFARSSFGEDYLDYSLPRFQKALNYFKTKGN